MKRLLIALPLVLMLCSCASKNRGHLGTWDARWGDESGTATVTEDTFTLTGEDPSEVISIRYTIDYSKDPIWIEMTANNDSAKGIMEFLGKDAFWLAVTEDGGPRPTAFTSADNIGIFKRVAPPKPKARRRTKDKLTGAWRGTAPEGGPVTLTMSQGLIKMELGDEVNFGEYSLDYTKKPIWFDYNDGEEAQKAIIEFIDKDSFRLSEPMGSRPASFENLEDAVVFKRIKDDKNPIVPPVPSGKLQKGIAK